MISEKNAVTFVTKPTVFKQTFDSNEIFCFPKRKNQLRL